MKINKIKREKNGRAVVVMEDGLSFPLGKKEVGSLGLAEGKELSGEQMDQIFEELVFTRGRNYLICLLASKDYTVAEAMRKLQKAEYPACVISEIIEYGIKKHYLDDMRYAEDYIRGHKGKDSVRKMFYKLSEKGIPSSMLDQLEAEDDKDGLFPKVCRYYEKKSGTAYERKAKTYQYFVRKGYSPGLVRELLQKIGGLDYDA